MRPEIIALLIPITALMIPIVAILVSHQQKMAQLIHGNPNNNQQNALETSQLRDEVRQLKELMNQQTIALDNLRDEFRTNNSLEQRLSDKI